MEKLKSNFLSYPFASSVIVTFLSVGLLFWLKAHEAEPEVLFNLPRLIVLAALSGAVCVVLVKNDWAAPSGLSVPFSEWQGRWYLAVLPFLVIAMLSSTSADWQGAELSTSRVSAWLISNFATGFFEEVLMRGLCFYLLVKAWGTTKGGVYLAAIAQAAIFGIAHFANLLHMPVLDVCAQVTFATLIGFGFAGLVYLTKSLWPAILVHTIINSAGTVNDYLVPGFEQTQSPGIAGYVVLITIILLLSVIPGLLYVRSSSTPLVPQS